MIERIFRCDGPECERHVQTRSLRPPTFLTVRDENTALHFCGWDCCLKYGARFPAEEIIPFGPPEESA